MDLIEVKILARGRQKWIDGITSKFKAKFLILHSKPSKRRDEVLQLFEITVDQSAKSKMLKHLLSSREVSELEVSSSSHGRVFGLVRAKGEIMRCIAESDCFLVSASGEYGSPIAWKVLGTKRSLRRLMSRLKAKKISYQVADISVVRRRKVLTTRQEWLLREAFERGYFDYPKKVRIRPLASALGVSAPTLHESLRKTQRRLIEKHFEGEGPPLLTKN
ncbi:MAG: helix-turn-helix domain-containing protein [Nitrososphaerota archaeon]|nr:helix-turn-helix domain-containing protein [Nitrososphaerota archaeon]MDG6975554.1 helix-turn-helix domain-containing protein [Nitrososphaerota archaeon]